MERQGTMCLAYSEKEHGADLGTARFRHEACSVEKEERFNLR
jgi:hypothetical protein